MIDRDREIHADLDLTAAVVASRQSANDRV
ncbi:hypothetical protein MHOL44478_04920 [Mycobacterium holsaticum DSM 44478]|nr:hypothetical protein [Mycolicibacterium holsaticum DSM 44478 = JCM 12374]